MDAKVERMLDSLAPAIDRKCAALRAARRERAQACLFALLCAAVALIPALLVLAGVSLAGLIVPLGFMAFSALFLLPVLLLGRGGTRGGTIYE